jgi:hypothetical protein
MSMTSSLTSITPSTDDPQTKEPTMAKPKSKPSNELEYLIQGALTDLVSIGTLYTVASRTSVWILCNKEWDGRTPDQDLKTLVMQPAEGPSMLPFWTGKERTAFAAEKYPDYPVAVQVMGAVLFTQAGGKVGLAVNPGDEFQFQLTPEGVDQLRQAFGPRVPVKSN